MKKHLLLLVFLLLTTFSFSQIKVGEGTETGKSIPIEAYYGYSYSQSIYSSTLIGVSGDITAITYYGTPSLDLSFADDWNVYIGHTSQSSFAGTSSWIDISTFDTVYSGTVSVVGDTVHIVFDSAFSYNGTENIVLAVEDNAGGYGAWGNHFYCTEGVTNNSIYYFNDSNNPDPSSPPQGAVNAFYPNITFHGLVQTCQKPDSLSMDSLTASSAYFEWVADSTSNFVVNVVETANSTVAFSDTLLAIGTSTSINALTPNTNYDFLVKEICGAGDTSILTTINFTTLCQSQVPDYLETFTNHLSNCWTRRRGIISDSTSFTNFETSNWDSGVFANTGSDDAAKINVYGNVNDWLISPTIDLGDGSIAYQLEFDAALTSYNSTSANTFGSDDQFSVVISENNGLTWSQNDTLRTWGPGMTFSNSGESVVIDLSAYTDEIKIAFYAYSPIINNDIDLYIDNFEVTEIPPCPNPINLDASSIMDTSAILSWSGNSNDSIYYVELGALGFELGTGFLIESNTDSLLMNSLTQSTEYEFYVSILCAGLDSSEWVGPFSFITGCGATSPPSTLETFDDVLPNICWSQAKGLLSDTTQFTSMLSSNWTEDGFGNDGYTGSARINIYGEYVNDWLITNSFDLGTAQTNYQVEFDLGLTNYFGTNGSNLGSDDKFAFIISTDNGNTWSSANVLQEWNDSNSISVEDKIVIDLSPYSGKVKFAFYGESQLSNQDINVYVDNFRINKCTDYIFIEDTVCTSFISPSGFAYDSTGIYTDTISLQTCDSVFIMDIVVNNVTFDFLEIIECDTFVSITGNQYTETGIYFDTIPNTNNCDSIIETYLSVLYVDLSIDMFYNFNLSSNESDPSASYQWVNCEDLTPIIGATSADFTASELGEYACKITIGNCTQLSECIEVTSLDSVTSIYQFEKSDVEVYPNPNNGYFTIDLNKLPNDLKLSISNTLGQVVYAQEVDDFKVNIELTDVEKGVYILNLKNDNLSFNKRILIK